MQNTRPTDVIRLAGSRDCSDGQDMAITRPSAEISYVYLL